MIMLVGYYVFLGICIIVLLIGYLLYLYLRNHMQTLHPYSGIGISFILITAFVFGLQYWIWRENTMLAILPSVAFLILAGIHEIFLVKNAVTRGRIFLQILLFLIVSIILYRTSVAIIFSNIDPYQSDYNSNDLQRFEITQ